MTSHRKGQSRFRRTRIETVPANGPLSNTCSPVLPNKVGELSPFSSACRPGQAENGTAPFNKKAR